MSVAVVEDKASVVETKKESFYVQHTVPSTVSNESETVAFVTQEVTDTVVVFVDNPTVVAAGWQGPSGPAGLAEEDVVYSKRIDFISDNLLYKGEAPVGSLESADVWRIRRIAVGSDGDVTEVWADGSSNFTHSWTQRLSYSYS